MSKPWIIFNFRCGAGCGGKGTALKMARIETIISASKVHRNTHRIYLKHGLLVSIPLVGTYICMYRYTSKTNHITYKKNEELINTRAIQRSKQGEYPELHHVSTAKGHADCHQNCPRSHPRKHQSF